MSNARTRAALRQKFAQARRCATALAKYVLLCNVTLLASCGYQLQKPAPLAQHWQPVFLEAGAATQATLRRELAAAGIATTSKRKLAGSLLSLQHLETGSHSLSISFDGRDAETLRSLSTQLLWRDSAGKTLADTALLAEEAQLASPGQRAAQQRESESLDELLRGRIARQALDVLQQYQQQHRHAQQH